MPTECEFSFRNKLVRLVELRYKRARRYVAEADSDPARAVHELRRICKELRALWRIVRPLVGEETFVRENFRLRDAARAMAGARDAAVVLATLDEMKRRRKGRRGRQQWREAAMILHGHIAETQADALEPASAEAIEPALAATLEAIRSTQVALAFMQPDASGLTWQPGVREVYRQGRKRMKKAYESGADADFHNWRKSTKYLFYQLRLLERIKQARTGKRVKALNKLEKTLGRDHDLVVLRERMTALSDGQAANSTIIEDITRASARLRKLARKPGKKLFGDKSEKFIQTIQKGPRSNSAPLAGNTAGE